MKPAKILILNFNPSDCLADDLRSIVQSQFEVEEVTIGEKLPDSSATECGKKLAQVISRSDFAVVFVVQSADRLKHTRHLLLSPGIQIPTTPLLVVVDEAARCTASELAVPMQSGRWIVLSSAYPTVRSRR